MTSFAQLPTSRSGEFRCKSNLDLFDTPNGDTLATQAATGRYVKLLSDTLTEQAIQVVLCEDGYQAWLPLTQLSELIPSVSAYRPVHLLRRDIEPRLGVVIAYLKIAMKQPNYYLWGGTIGPNYDCSGLMQAAFASVGIWLPRDSYQQEDFVKKVDKSQLLPGDLIFFGINNVNHVGLYTGEGNYIHSSGQEMGRNGIACDRLWDGLDEISRSYAQKLWSCGRVMASYCPS